MTPAELRDWRKAMEWTTLEAATRLGISHRAYKYLEQRGRLSGDGSAHEQIPPYIQLATAELSRLMRRRRPSSAE